jgi:K+-sensing histidine kinase KdpD
MSSNERLRFLCTEDQRQQEVLEIQESSGKFLQNLIEDILDLSRMQFDHFTLNYSSFALEDVVDEVMQIVSF